jgi:hypothetical protein
MARPSTVAGRPLSFLVTATAAIVRQAAVVEVAAVLAVAAPGRRTGRGERRR